MTTKIPWPLRDASMYVSGTQFPWLVKWHVSPWSVSGRGGARGVVMLLPLFKKPGSRRGRRCCKIRYGVNSVQVLIKFDLKSRSSLRTLFPQERGRWCPLENAIANSLLENSNHIECLLYNAWRLKPTAKAFEKSATKHWVTGRNRHCLEIECDPNI